MEEKEIKKIFGKYLMDVGEGEGGIGAGVEMAVASTLCETFKASLHQLLKNGPIDNGHLAIVELAIETKSSLCVQTSIDLGEVTALMPGGSPEAFLDIYHKFNSIVQFLDSNLENLKFGTRLSKEAVQKYLKQ
ncbi:MAG: hypothetical protein HYT65_01910, partial [Candidatus Yanofskybacteria bacterium]|nr:hypothetical protein [Candidatus Yanofskybacteria bacterium]